MAMTDNSKFHAVLGLMLLLVKDYGFMLVLNAPSSRLALILVVLLLA